MPTDQWRLLQNTTIDQMRAGGGTITIRVNDHAQRILVRTLERMAGANAVTKVLVDGPLITYKLREDYSAEDLDVKPALTSSGPTDTKA